ncbi:hypothetical protein B9Z55_012193 [Caenorhabditis nigoni]|uniref:Sex-determining region Y protein n=2 Tax=Caenorhabditis nigoni TaxID=1611254 RepID=A0A2G5TX34_9PELO|nr:hypothetical protein B9Z55_012193 [Caenorhabditis nigoni]
MLHMRNDSSSPDSSENYSNQNPVSAKKPPVLAFGLWRQDNQHKFDGMYSNMSSAEKITKMRTVWRHHTSAEEREFYYAKEKQLKMQRDHSLAIQEPILIENSPSMVQQVTKPEQHVKRPLNPFMVYCQVRRAELAVTDPGLPSAEILKRLGAGWGAMSVEEKRPFYDEASKLKEELYKAHPNYKYAPQKKPAVHVSTPIKPAMTPIKPAVVPTRSVLTPSAAPNVNQLHKISTSQPVIPTTPLTPIPYPTRYEQCRQPTPTHDYCFEYPRTSGVVIHEGQENYGSSCLPVWF